MSNVMVVCTSSVLKNSHSHYGVPKNYVGGSKIGAVGSNDFLPLLALAMGGIELGAG